MEVLVSELPSSKERGLLASTTMLANTKDMNVEANISTSVFFEKPRSGSVHSVPTNFFALDFVFIQTQILSLWFYARNFILQPRHHFKELIGVADDSSFAVIPPMAQRYKTFLFHKKISIHPIAKADGLSGDGIVIIINTIKKTIT